MRILDLLEEKIRYSLKMLKIITKVIMSLKAFQEISNKYRYALKYRFRKFFYYGNIHYCPCCERYLRKFAPFGEPRRLNAECPFCYVMERHRIRYLFFKNRTNFFSANLRVLDVGPEFFLQKIFRSLPNLDYVSADINPDNAMLQMDVTAIKFEDNSFDFILCLSVIEHVVNDKKAICELFRVLKHGGYAIIEVPINYDLKETVEFLTKNEKIHHNKDLHVREYGPDFIDLLKKIGFKIYIINFKKELPINKINFYGLMNCEENIYICYKTKVTDKVESFMKINLNL